VLITPHPLSAKLGTNVPTSDDRSVGSVRTRTEVTELIASAFALPLSCHGPVLPHAVTVPLLFTHSLPFCPQGGVIISFRNVGRNVPDYTTSRLSSDRS
jgi:hypothetical protein